MSGSEQRSSCVSTAASQALAQRTRRAIIYVQSKAMIVDDEARPAATFMLPLVLLNSTLGTSPAAQPGLVKCNMLWFAVHHCRQRKHQRQIAAGNQVQACYTLPGCVLHAPLEGSAL